MGNNSSAATAAAGDAIQARIKKEKKKAKRLCCCCCLFHLGGVIGIVVGIVLLVYFAASLGNSYSGSSPIRDKNLSYTGIAFLILGVILLAIGVIIAIVVYMMYRRITGKASTSINFTPKTYAPGTAPYPQENWGDAQNPHAANQPAAPAGPAAPATPGPPPAAAVDIDTIKPEVA